MYDKIQEYADYIRNHIFNIKKALSIYGEMLCYELQLDYDTLSDQIKYHDDSKWWPEEFNLYRLYFYPDNNEEKISEKEFNVAWLNHIHNNQHHPEHWVYFNCEDKSYTVYDIPETYIAEMLLDWIAMSYAKGGTAYGYYEENKNKILLTDKTRLKVEYLLDKIESIDNNNLQ